MSEENALATAKSSLKRLQDFDAQKLVRREDLGATFEFSDAVDPAKKLIALFQKLPIDSLYLFPEQQLREIENASNSVFKIFSDILEFDPSEPEAKQKREGLVQKLVEQYQPTFNKLFQYISFSVARTADFLSLAEEGRATVQGVRDEVQGLLDEIQENQKASERAVDEIRKVAAERGVSQEAYHFQTQADQHLAEAGNWRATTLKWAYLLIGYSVLTLFLHKIPWLAPVSPTETAQFIVSKVLIFGVIAFMLSLSARNFLSHKHNEVLNRQKQNALMTYRSLVEATGAPEARDIVLQSAATAIYGVSDSGFVKSSDSNTNTIREILPRTSLPLSSTQSGQ